MSGRSIGRAYNERPNFWFSSDGQTTQGMQLSTFTAAKTTQLWAIEMKDGSRRLLIDN